MTFNRKHAAGFGLAALAEAKGRVEQAEYAVSIMGQNSWAGQERDRLLREAKESADA